MILSDKDLIDGIPVLSSTEIDAVLKEFAQFLNIQISQDVSQVLKFCRFYLESWETLDTDYTKTLNDGLPKENISDKTSRQSVGSLYDLQTKFSCICRNWFEVFLSSMSRPLK